ncbi:bifunctional folylpolyglutamate synthase/dihydrofolate synthase [Candidatus Nanosynbacter lyticus]|uniref:bifunctional folylpolyglutamate synthase/dihydrofolate synthase n=1 Tax=Candidatus Nanosynbacter lyticus TaxID=2093824 RepID=UPI0025540938|nr:Mur ligase family protein [Candidatus Nanosynbacter lyticus]WLD46444.1 bifunctional folylpolyglutamate synthase/dihydrofolate synthase [Candidatus Nanosynbacter lyticus]
MKFASMRDATYFLDELIAHPPKKHDRLAYVAHILETLGSPQNQIPAIHIAGTSGKGSTAYYATSLLNRAGYTTGMLVSPHIASVAERSLINGQPLPEQEYLHYFQAFANLYIVHNLHLSYFEFLTIFSFWLFKEMRVDYIIIEVGIGGRLDTTNVIFRSPTVRVITDIGLDHTELLGNTLTEIAQEKAGIIHQSDSVVMNRQASEIEMVVRQRAEEQHTQFSITSPVTSEFLKILPDFQQRNWTLAYRAVEKQLALNKKPSLPKEVLEKSVHITIPGRLEKRNVDGVNIIFDVAHNPQKIRALIDSLRKLYPDKKPIFVVAFGQNKQSSIAESLAIIDNLAQLTYATTFSTNYGKNHRNMPPEIIRHVMKSAVEIEHNTDKALAKAIKKARQLDTYVVVTGSFYLVSEFAAR